MPTYRSKALTNLLEVEKELKALVGSLKTTKSKKAAKQSILDAKNIVGKALLEMPSSEQYLAPIKKALTPILNTLGGLADGLQDDSIDLKDFHRTVDNVNKRFIPKFRDEVDRVVKKVSAESARFKDGLLHTDESILEELRKVSGEVKRLVRTLSAASSDKLNNSQVSTMLQARAELASSTYEALPAGKDLDEAASTLQKIAEHCFVQSGYALSRGEIKKPDIVKLSQMDLDLTKDIAAINKKVMNNILTYDDSKSRKPLKKTLRGKADDLPLTRSSEEYLKEKISDIKEKKNDLPKRLKGPFGMLRTPVVAIFDSQDDIAKRDRPSGPGTITHNFSKQKLLDQFGIKYVMLEDYVILQEQMILAVDRQSVEKMAKAEFTSKKKRGTFRMTDALMVEYARQMLSMLNERGSQDYVMVSPEFTANPRNANMLLFWVMPARILNVLISRGWNKLSEWSLPFDH